MGLVIRKGRCIRRPSALSLHRVNKQTDNRNVCLNTPALAKHCHVGVRGLFFWPLCAPVHMMKAGRNEPSQDELSVTKSELTRGRIAGTNIVQVIGSHGREANEKSNENGAQPIGPYICTQINSRFQVPLPPMLGLSP